MKKKYYYFIFVRLTIVAFILLNAGCRKDDENGTANGNGNDNGTESSGVIGFPQEPVTDLDGNSYSTIITVGGQEWMTKNLRVSRYANGDSIPGILGSGWDQTFMQQKGAWTIYDPSGVEGISTHEEMEEAYGKLYNWFAVNDSRGLCPSGWRVADKGDWEELIDVLITTYGLTNEESDVNGVGNALKAAYQDGHPWGRVHNVSEHPRWSSHARWITDGKHYGTDKLGFSALPAGWRAYTMVIYSMIGQKAYYWSSSESVTNPVYAHAVFLSHDAGNVKGGWNDKRFGFSVRCMRNVGD